MLLRDWQEAELLAMAAMRDMGFPDACLTRRGSDGGVDVTSSDAVAQVKFEGAAVGRSALQRLYGARGDDRTRQMLFFSRSGYSAPAIAYADEVRMALFTYTLSADLQPSNRAALLLLADAPAISGNTSTSATPRSSESSSGPTVLWPLLWSLGFWMLVINSANTLSSNQTGWQSEWFLWLWWLLLVGLAMLSTAWLVKVLLPSSAHR